MRRRGGEVLFGSAVASHVGFRLEPGDHGGRSVAANGSLNASRWLGRCHCEEARAIDLRRIFLRLGKEFRSARRLPDQANGDTGVRHAEGDGRDRFQRGLDERRSALCGVEV